jgi:hypothetical protein
VFTSSNLDKKVSDSIGNTVKIEKPTTGAYGTEISSASQKLVKTEENEPFANSTLKAITADEYPHSPLVGARTTNSNRRIPSNRHGIDMPWVHDKFEMRLTPVSGRQENVQLQSSYNSPRQERGRSHYPILGPMTDSYRPSSRDSNSSILRHSSHLKPENSKKPGVYISLEKIAAEGMEEWSIKGGISTHSGQIPNGSQVKICTKWIHHRLASLARRNSHLDCLM